jgi:hypothetical protein
VEPTSSLIWQPLFDLDDFKEWDDETGAVIAGGLESPTVLGDDPDAGTIAIAFERRRPAMRTSSRRGRLARRLRSSAGI